MAPVAWRDCFWLGDEAQFHPPSGSAKRLRLSRADPRPLDDIFKRADSLLMGKLPFSYGPDVGLMLGSWTCQAAPNERVQRSMNWRLGQQETHHYW